MRSLCFIGVLMLLMCRVAYAQNPAPGPSVQNPDTYANHLDKLDRDVSDLKKGLNEVRIFIEDVKYYTPYTLGVIAAIFSFWAAIANIRQWQREARRALQEQEHNKQLHERELALDRRYASNDVWMRGVMEIFTKGEEAAQRRASELHDQLFSKSALTLTLVNETLALTKEASQRALKENERRVEIRIKEIDDEIKAFLRPFANRDTRDIVNDQVYRDRLQSIILKLEAVDVVNSFLPEPLPFFPHTSFIKALSYQVKNLPDETIDLLKELESEKIDDTDLKTRVFYWLGFELNNIGDFVEAEKRIIDAINLQIGRRRLMLKRLLVETLLYNTDNKAKNLVNNSDRLIDDEFFNDLDANDKALVLITKENVLYAAAMEAYHAGDQKEARSYLEQGIEALASVINYSMQAKANYSFANIMLGHNVEVMKESLDGEIKLWAQETMGTQINPRLKAMYNFIQLLIAKITNPSAVDSIHTRSSQLVAEVHKKYTIYSPLRRRNVKQEDFRADVRRVVRQGIPDLSRS